VAASSKEDDLKALRLQLEKEEELLRMKQQENEHRILGLQLRVREAEDDISQNGNEKMKNWLYNDNDSICEDKKVVQSEEDDQKNRFLRCQEVWRTLMVARVMICQNS
jgi:hypothetical protein